MINKNSALFRENFLDDRDSISQHGIDSCHDYFGMHEEQYLVHKSEAKNLIKELKETYMVLKIEGNERHTYLNTYMDTKKFGIYNRESKQKSYLSVRNRKYINQESLYFQIKHTSNERTNIYSYIYNEEDVSKLTTQMRSRYSGIYESVTWKQPKELIFPSVTVSYDRYILYHKKNNERVDIDFNIRFVNLRDSKLPEYTLKNIVMIESKSSEKNTEIAKKLKKIKTKKANVGIYPLALHYINYPTKNKEVQKTVKKIIKLQKMK